MMMSPTSISPAFASGSERQQRRGRIAARTGDQPRRGGSPRDSARSARRRPRPAGPARGARGRTIPHRSSMSRSRKSADMSMTLISGLAARTAAVISCVVPCGRPQNAASRPLQSTFSHSTRLRQVEHEEMRKDLRHRLAGMRVGGERDDLDVRMARGEAHEVGAGIAGRAENADPDLLHGLPFCRRRWALAGSPRGVNRGINPAPPRA